MQPAPLCPAFAPGNRLAAALASFSVNFAFGFRLRAPQDKKKAEAKKIAQIPAESGKKVEQRGRRAKKRIGKRIAGNRQTATTSGEILALGE